jgi:hypothetical protein
MKKPSKSSSLAAHLDARRLIAEARHEAHGRGAVALSKLEVRRELARLDAEILDLEDTIARMPENGPSFERHFRFLWFKVTAIRSNKQQLRELANVLKTWRGWIANDEGPRAIAAARALAEHLVRSRNQRPAEESEEIEAAEPEPSPSSRGGNGHDPDGGRWG